MGFSVRYATRSILARAAPSEMVPFFITSEELHAPYCATGCLSLTRGAVLLFLVCSYRLFSSVYRLQIKFWLGKHLPVTSSIPANQNDRCDILNGPASLRIGGVFSRVLHHSTAWSRYSQKCYQIGREFSVLLDFSGKFPYSLSRFPALRPVHTGLVVPPCEACMGVSKHRSIGTAFLLGANDTPRNLTIPGRCPTRHSPPDFSVWPVQIWGRRSRRFFRS